MKGNKLLNDQRRIQRHHLPYYLQVHNRATGKILGYIVNISQKGMMLVTKHPVLIHAIFELQIRLPDPINGKSTINFEALSHWCHPDVTPGCFDTGFSFSTPPPELLELISKISEYFTFNIFQESGENKENPKLEELPTDNQENTQQLSDNSSLKDDNSREDDTDNNTNQSGDQNNTKQ